HNRCDALLASEGDRGERGHTGLPGVVVGQSDKIDCVRQGRDPLADTEPVRFSRQRDLRGCQRAEWHRSECALPDVRPPSIRSTSSVVSGPSATTTRMLRCYERRISSAYRKPHTCWQHHAAESGGVHYSEPARTKIGRAHV